VRVDFEVHRNADIGSPRVCGSTNASNAAASPGSVSVKGFRPPPGRRTRPVGAAPEDGKWLLRTSDSTLTPDDLAAAYKTLLQVERGWRDMKGALGLRPVFHYGEDRIRAHVGLCWLALLLMRVVENATNDTWRNVRHELDRMHLVTLATADGHVAQRSATTAGQNTILAALQLGEPARFFDFTIPTD